jgi:glycosyltransferase involved in cell wall biosynthesis
MNKVRLLFQPSIDADNTNAQSLNAREIALRLDPDRIESTLWFEREPDPRLMNRKNIRLLQLPKHRKTLRILREQFSGYDVIAYTDYSPATYLFLHSPRMLRGRTKSVLHAEAPAAQIVNPPRMSRFLYAGIFPNCDVHTAISQFVARDVLRVVSREVACVLPVGVDTEFFTPPPERNNSVPTVLFVGTLLERKGPQHLLQAALTFPEAQFRLVGAGRNGFDLELRSEIKRLQLKNVILEGPQGQRRVLESMQHSDIFVLPSRLEGIPKVTLEAAATGLPCIVFRDYETPSVLDGITGFQVSTVEEMMSRISQLIAHPDLRATMGRAARKHVQDFDWNVISKQWEDAYLAIAAQRN